MTGGSSFTENLVAVFRATRRVGEAIAERHGLSLHQVIAMYRLDEVGQCMMSDLTAHLEITSGAGTRITDRLQSAGLVARTSAPDDRRVTLIALTDQGREVLSAIRAEWELKTEEWCAAMAPELRTSTERVLAELAAAAPGGT